MKPSGFTRASLAVLLASILASAAFAQGVGINGTGASADASAMLDLSSTTKGFLPPRMTAAQRSAIFSPATGLLVYQTDGVVGLYYNAGSPSVPNWQVAGAGAGGQWLVSGANLYYMAGKVAIGTPPSEFGLSVADALNGLRAATGTAGGKVASFGGVGKFEVDAPFFPGGRLELLENGNLGIGNTAPTNPLSFASVLGKKISLYHDLSGGDYGLGIENSRIKIYSGNANADVAIGYDNAGTFVEKLAVKPTGALAISGNNGSAGQVLTSGGATGPPTWSNPIRLVSASVTGTPTISSGETKAIPGMSVTVTIPSNGATVLLTVSQPVLSTCLVCVGARIDVVLTMDGSASRYGVASSYIHGDSGHGLTVSFTTVLANVAPGTHIFEVWIANYGLDPVQPGDGGVSSALVAQIFPN